MKESERYEKRVLDMLAKSERWAYWDFSWREAAALNRLINRGVVHKEVVGYPYWWLTTLPVDDKQGGE